MATLSTSVSSSVVYQELKPAKSELIEKKEKKKGWFEFETDLIWTGLTVLLTQQVLFAYFTLTFPYLQHPVLVLWGLITLWVSLFGVTGGTHRHWCHRTYKAKLPVRIILAMCFYTTGHYTIWKWAHVHRQHHKHADTDADPHNARRGFFFSHLGWLVMEEKPECTEAAKNIDISDVLSDPVVQFFDKHYIFFQLLFTFLLPTFVPVYFFNQSLKYAAISQLFIRHTLALHIIASVNSWAHTFGYRVYDKAILPRENIFVGITAIGEGWHNYHHAFPWDYKASEFSNWFFNSTATCIELFAKLGLAYDLRSVTSDQIKKVIEARGNKEDQEIYEKVQEVHRILK